MWSRVSPGEPGTLAPALARRSCGCSWSHESLPHSTAPAGLSITCFYLGKRAHVGSPRGAPAAARCPQVQPGAGLLAAISPSPGENRNIEAFLTSSIRKKKRKPFRSLSKGVLSAQEGFPAAKNRAVLREEGKWDDAGIDKAGG